MKAPLGPESKTEAVTPGQTLQHLAYAEASLMLVECLMRGLLEKKLLSSQEIVLLIESAIDTKRQMVADGEHEAIAAVAAGTLIRLANDFAVPVEVLSDVKVG